VKEIIFSTSAKSQPMAINEILQMDEKAKLLTWLDEGVGLVQLANENFISLSQKILDTKAVFIRHLFPVSEKIPLSHSTADFSTLQDLLNQEIHHLDLQKTISVQTRFSGTIARPYSRFELTQAIADNLVAAGYSLDVRQPEQVISIFCTDELAYVGISLAQQNLSNWAGGMHRFAHEPEQISRAEFKLLEAIDVFALQLPQAGLALDLGASPGGWTRVLRQRGLAVVAVDPGDLTQALQQDPAVTHYRQLAQNFLPTCREQFDMLVNDMRLDAIESAKIMLLAHAVLREKGLAIMTLKLPTKGAQRLVKQAIAILEKKYEIAAARQLFHNRQEVTLALHPKPREATNNRIPILR
jgi:23S rRNA (cytidine2498-2'-O)-methyltransferase